MSVQHGVRYAGDLATSAGVECEAPTDDVLEEPGMRYDDYLELSMGRLTEAIDALRDEDAERWATEILELVKAQAEVMRTWRDIREARD